MTGTDSVPILVVTTDDDLAETLSDGLRILGHVPVVAGGAGEALDRIRRDDVDVLLLDLVLSDAGRLDLPRRIGEAELATETIVLAPPADFPAALEAMRRGAHDFLPRPPKMDEFGVRVGKAVERAQLRREILALRRQLDRAIVGHGGFAASTALTLDELELQYIETVLRENDGHRGRTAKALGIDPKTLYNKLGPERPRKKEPPAVAD
jgi:DNA-binding NtrC family response regulator